MGDSKGLSGVKISKTTLYAIAGVIGGIVLVLTSLMTIKRMRAAKAADEDEREGGDDRFSDDSNASPKV